MKLSQRVTNLEPSVTLAATAKAKELKAQGLDVISLTVGEPDFTTRRISSKLRLKESRAEWLVSILLPAVHQN